MADIGPEEQKARLQTQLEELKAKYLAAAHALQTGIKVMQEQFGSECGTPKHLRVGVNLRAVDIAGLTNLLMKKGVITELEYYIAINETLDAEVKHYEEVLTEKYGREVKLA